MEIIFIENHKRDNTISAANIKKTKLCKQLVCFLSRFTRNHTRGAACVFYKKVQAIMICMQDMKTSKKGNNVSAAGVFLNNVCINTIVFYGKPFWERIIEEVTTCLPQALFIKSNI